MTKYLGKQKLADDAQPCPPTAGQWVRHPTGAVGLMLEDRGREVRVEFNSIFRRQLLTWDKKGLRVVAKPSNYFDAQGTLRNADGSRSIFDDVDQ